MAELRRRAQIAGSEAGFGSFVWGDGFLRTSKVIVGEAPGAEEVRDGKPFVGKAGRLLRAELTASGIHPEELWITNVVKHRPTRESDRSVANRAPNAGEIRFWLPWLIEELAVLAPRYLLCLGGVAAKAIVMGFRDMGSARGRWMELPSGIRAMVTYHPSYVLRTVGFGDPTVTAQFREDLAEFASAP